MMKKSLALFMALVLAFSVFGCKKAGTDEEVVDNIPKDKDTVVAYVGEDPVTKEEYLYYLKGRLSDIASYMTKDTYEEYLDEDISGMPAAEYIKKTALDDAKQLRVIEQKYAELGYDFDKKSGADYKSAMESAIKYFGGEKEFQNVLKQDGISPEFFERRQKAIVMSQTVNEEYFTKEGAANGVSEDEIKQVFETNYVRVKHILLKTRDDAGAEVSAEEKAKKKAEAEEILSKIKAGEDFETLMNEYNEDEGMKSYPDGYVFTFGKMDAPFETAAFALKAGEVSDLVEGYWGYHIIKGYDKSDEKYYEQVKEEISQKLLSENVQKVMLEWLGALEVKPVDEELAKEDLQPKVLLKDMLELIEKQQAAVDEGNSDNAENSGSEADAGDNNGVENAPNSDTSGTETDTQAKQ